MNSKNPALTPNNNSSNSSSNNAMIKVSSSILPLTHSNNSNSSSTSSSDIKAYTSNPTLIAPKLAPSSGENASNSRTNPPTTFTSRPLILKSVSQSIKPASQIQATNTTMRLSSSGGSFVPIRPREGPPLPLPLPVPETTYQSQKIIKLTNGPQFKCLNTTDLLNNLKTSTHMTNMPSTLSLMNSKLAEAVNSCKTTTIAACGGDSSSPVNVNTTAGGDQGGESRKRKRKQDLSIISRNTSSDAFNQSSSESQDLVVPPRFKTISGRKKEEMKPVKSSPLLYNSAPPHHSNTHQHQHQHHHQGSPFKVSASLFKLKNSESSKLGRSRYASQHNDDEEFDEDDEDADDDDFLDDGISDEDEGGFALNGSSNVQEEMACPSVSIKKECFDIDYLKPCKTEQIEGKQTFTFITK